MAYNYGPLAATADRLIARFGLDAAIIKRTRTGGTASNPTYSSTPYPCKVVRDTFTGMERANSNIAATDLKVICAPLDIDITAADRLEMDGATYDIVDPVPYRPGPVTLAWAFAARR